MEPFFVFSFILILSLLLPNLSLSSNDTDALTQFRLHSDSHGNLSGNWTTSASAGDACAAAWRGVHCIDGRVAALSLPSLDLRGPLDPLARLDQLRILDLHGNRINGTLLPVANCSNLKLLYLAGNDFSGEIPPELGSLRRLRRLDLSNNNLRGSIPSSLVSGLTRLLTLYLENNVLSGSIPDFANSSILQLNLSNNQLRGHLPETLIEKFGNQSFLGNQDLCGSTPLPNCSSTVDLGTPPPAGSTAESTVPSNPSSLPTSPLTYSDKKEPRKGLSPGAIAAIVIGNSVLLLVLVSFAVAYCCGKYSRESNYSSKVGTEEGKRRSGSSYGNEKKVYDSDGTNATDRSKLVFYDRTKQFELEDLLRASAEMLGKGSFGTVYRAVLDNGATVAVKRLKDANPCVRKDFEQYMDVIGKMKHPNIVRLRAYYYAKEEKLLVYDYLPNGSLHSLLHSNRGPGRIPLDWTTRISLVLGAARGLARIHQEYNSPKIPHGNVKSSNILLDKNGVACISDFGLSLLLNPIHATARLGGYRAPEQAETKRLSQKADVYGFGVLVLELLTGREPLQHASPMRPRTEEEGEGLDLPKWVRSVVRDEWTSEVFDEELLRYKNIEEELVAMLQVGLACVVPQPERRPTMSEVAKMIEEIRVEQSPLGEDCDESRNSLSPSLATTEDGLGAY